MIDDFLFLLLKFMKIVDFWHEENLLNFNVRLNVQVFKKLFYVVLNFCYFWQIPKYHTEILDASVSLMMIGGEFSLDISQIN